MEQVPAQAAVQDVVIKREPPCFVLFDERCGVLGADPRIREFCTLEQLQHLVRDIDGDATLAFRAMDEFVGIRITSLDAAGNRFVTVALERLRTRAPLPAAARTFSLSDREVQVLQLILCGLEGRDIAERLNIAPATVREYFKHLAIKIGGRNRAEMIARVLDYRME